VAAGFSGEIAIESLSSPPVCSAQTSKSPELAIGSTLHHWPVVVSVIDAAFGPGLANHTTVVPIGPEYCPVPVQSIDCPPATVPPQSWPAASVGAPPGGVKVIEGSKSEAS
jgi:hypothetical protein